MTSTLDARIRFLREVDLLKSVYRRTSLGDRSRLENSAEHSWHLAVMALTLAPEAPDGVRVDHVIRMLLVHDLVEIDAGDTFAFDNVGAADKAEREQAAADRLFGLLPIDTAQQFHALWQEFEAGETREARMANALDRFGAIVQNTQKNDGGTYRLHDIARSAVLRRMAPIQDGLPALWPYVVSIVDDCVRAGHIREDAS